MWSDSLHWVHSKVAMLLIKGTGGGGCDDLVNPMGALTVLMSKWIIKACKPSSSNLHILI